MRRLKELQEKLNNDEKIQIGIREEISGFIGVEANSKEKAEELAEGLINEYGVEDCLYNGLSTCAGKILWSKHCHGDRELLSCEEANG